MRSNVWRFSALLLLLQFGSSHAAECTALTENVLTSSGCPSDCNDNPCVLYSPSQDECVELGASGPCYSDSSFTLPGTSTECNVTYQCMDSLLWDGNQWLLALEANAETSEKTMAYVTEITELTYDSSTLSVQLQGTPTESTSKSDIKDISLDQTFFDTPSGVVSMFLMSVNLRTTISSVSLATTYKTLYLENANLNAVPDQFANFSAVTKLDLSLNYITDLPDNTSDVWTGLSTVTDLNLAYNTLTDFPAVLDNLQTLNLSGNAYATIPDNVYTMAESGALKYLYMSSCNLTNLQVSDSQLALLENLAAFDADVTITDCGSGYASTTLSNANVQLCTVSTSSSNDGGGGSHTLAIVLGVVCGVLVVAIVAFVWYRKKHGGQFSTKGGSTIFGTDIGSSLTGGDTTFGSSIWDDPDLLAARIEHRDVEAIKLLSRGGFGESGAKLSDFGISRNRSFDETMTAGVGTARWIAPEVILGGHYTEFADIYSFGVVLSELDTCKAPFYDATNTNGGKMQDVTILQLVSAGKLQPSFDESSPPSIVKLARACLSFDPAQRPSAIHISYELRKIMKDEL
ncbi:putative serine/threonine-protein kinase [Phytophthora ramorum]|uniref:putative serine/threonine-protein kinase n=1 Tax=Phytophthora ramorum TaxID=164328 RepID=UPI0030AE9524|nr:putative serine/threonine-protein kinase [Phytophthora ramorum]